MATTGKAAWEKYYEGKGDLETIVSKQTPVFDLKNKNSVTGQLQPGTKVVVLESKTYDNRPIVTYSIGKTKYKVRVKFECLQKPGLAPRGAAAKSSDKTIANKALTPSQLGLGGKIIEKSRFKTVIKEAVKACTVVEPHVKIFLNDLIEKSESSNLRLNESVSKITDVDLKIIEKDFGEIIGAWWFLNNYDKNLVKVEFPREIATPLVDYFVHYKNGTKLKVSAKAREGAAPSISNVYNLIENKRFYGKEESVKKFIASIAENSGKEGIVAASKLYKSSGYAIISKLMKDDNLTDEKIEKWLATFKKPASLYSYLQDNYYTKINRAASLPIIQRIYATNGTRSGIVTSPMAYSLVDEVNQNKNYIEFLTRVCNTENIQQLYLDINKRLRVINFVVKEFKDSKFEFEYHSNAGNPGGNKIGFKLVK